MIIELVKGDITKIPVGAIVNAANAELAGGGGVDGAIHRAGGESIALECAVIRHEQGGCQPGEAVITTAGNLPANYVIHTVGPIWKGGSHEEEDTLARAYRSSLSIAAMHEVESISFPNISTGVYGFPKERAAEIAVTTVQESCIKFPGIKKIYFVCFDEENYLLYKSLLKG